MFKPFAIKPASFPVFYGWPMLLVSMLGMLASIPGQTIGISVFNDRLIEALSISRNQLSMAYLIGTISSAAILTHGGKAYDRLGGRKLVVLVTALLTATLLFFSVIDTAVQLIAGTGIPYSVAAMVLLTLGFFLVRFFAQGMLELISKNLIMEWFDQRRGQTNALLGVTMALGSAAAPRLLDPFIQQYGWNSAWRLLALLVGGYCLFAGLFYRNRPENFGLKPDGGTIAKRTISHADAVPGRSFTLRQARRTFSFWLFILTVTLSSLLATAVIFHVISMFSEAGHSRTAAVGVFIPVSVVAIIVQFSGSWISDYVPLRWLAVVHNLGCVITCAGVITLTPGKPPVLFIIGLGLVQGMMGITANITWARYFGRMHLGAIAGNAQAWSVAGSAMGPYIFSLIFEATGYYRNVAILFGVMSLILAVMSVAAKRPQ